MLCLNKLRFLPEYAVRSGYETGVGWQWMVLDGKSWRQDGKENSKDA
jgi:hypothetical protein|tara:strand:- start:90 stop:230 length:141 start_codon:yes stop_codon:yes gene_type:complete